MEEVRWREGGDQERLVEPSEFSSEDMKTHRGGLRLVEAEGRKCCEPLQAEARNHPWLCTHAGFLRQVQGQDGQKLARA